MDRNVVTESRQIRLKQKSFESFETRLNLKLLKGLISGHSLKSNLIIKTLALINVKEDRTRRISQQNEIAKHRL